MMTPSEPTPGPTIRGRPGQAARAWGLWHAALPLAALLFFAGFVLGSALRPAGLQGTPAGALLLCMALAIAGLGKRAQVRLRRHHRGAEGEEKVARILDNLPHTWHVFHGVPLANHLLAKRLKGGRDADHIAIGPGGIYLIETVNWSGRISLQDSQILDNAKAYPGHTLDVFREAADALDAWLREENPDTPAVTPVFCAAGGRYAPGLSEHEDLLFREPETLLHTLTQVKTPQLTPEQINRIAAQIHNLWNAMADEK